MLKRIYFGFICTRIPPGPWGLPLKPLLVDYRELGMLSGQFCYFKTKFCSSQDRESVTLNQPSSTFKGAARTYRINMILASKLRSFIAGSTSQVLRSPSNYLAFPSKIGRLFPPDLMYVTFQGKKTCLL
jgi:hypothetical protein